MGKNLWKIRYIIAPNKILNVFLAVLQRNGHTKGVLYKLPKKRITEKTCKDIIESLEDEVGALYIGSCIVDEEMIKKATIIKEYEI